MLEYGYHSSCQGIPARNELEYEYPASCIQHIYLPAASTEYEYPYSCLQRVHSTSTPPVSSTNTCPQRVRVRVALQLLTNACPHELEYEYPSSCIQRVPASNEYRVRVPLQLYSTSTCPQRVQSTSTLELPGRNTEGALCGCKNTSFPHAYTHKRSFYMSLKYGRMLVDRTPPCFSIIPPTCVQFQQIPAWPVAKRSDTPQTVVDGQWRPLWTGNRLRKGSAVFDLERTPGNASRVSGNPILSACS